MFLGRVIGHVWSTVKWPELEGLKFLMVRPYHLGDLLNAAGKSRPSNEVVSVSPEAIAGSDAVVAADVLGAGIGEDVVIAYGHAARAGLEELLPQDRKPSHPIDAAVVAIVDRFQAVEPR